MANEWVNSLTSFGSDFLKNMEKMRSSKSQADATPGLMSPVGAFTMPATVQRPVTSTAKAAGTTSLSPYTKQTSTDPLASLRKWADLMEHEK